MYGSQGQRHTAGRAGAAADNRIEACHLAGHRRHICAEELPKSPRRVRPPEGKWSCTKRRGAARTRAPDVAGLAPRPDTAGARWTGRREAAGKLTSRRTLAGRFWKQTIPGAALGTRDFVIALARRPCGCASRHHSATSCMALARRACGCASRQWTCAPATGVTGVSGMIVSGANNGCV